jgi:hypothetical protein
MKTKLLKISMLITALMFVFAGASWAEGGKNRQRNKGPEKRIESKGHGGSSYRQPVHYKPKINRHQKHFYKNNRYRHRPANRYRYHKFYHRNRWIRNHLQHRPGRHYSENSYDDDLSTNEFSIATTVSQPGVEFSIGAKRTW